jgi:Na+-translocating ferredoxin:NAD+ oxidoreductase RNF subunit RnfB
MAILIPVLTLSVLGLIFGVGLALAAKKFSVNTDPMAEAIFMHLAGANCGACGMAGCMGFAESLMRGESSVDKCPVTEPEKKTEIAKLLGQEVKIKVKTVAVLHCGGGNKVKDRFIYSGIKDCNAANLLQGGQKACVYGCLGFGSCVSECPFGAISMNAETGLPQVDESKCTACARCVAICPKKLFSITAVDKKFYVNCASLDFGKAVLDACPVGCIGCKKCEKSCPVQAIKVVNNLAIFDYNKCQNIGECLKVCPTKAIRKRG